jgi:hypothetical protein
MSHGISGIGHAISSFVQNIKNAFGGWRLKHSKGDSQIRDCARGSSILSPQALKSRVTGNASQETLDSLRSRYVAIGVKSGSDIAEATKL